MGFPPLSACLYQSASLAASNGLILFRLKAAGYAHHLDTQIPYARSLIDEDDQDQLGIFASLVEKAVADTAITSGNSKTLLSPKTSARSKKSIFRGKGPMIAVGAAAAAVGVFGAAGIYFLTRKESTASK